ncbi:MAG: carboxypeptidase regulatory-like domain-containing protein [Acidobacteria bacterium]|nr:carboxypeptidase regulatory-like domain-containing protein [Acidobacteriota bacterium]
MPRIVFLGILAVAGALAQDTGTITGFVTDASKAVVPGVEITVTDLATRFQRTTTTNDSGVYAVTLLPVGRYEVKASKSGFKTFIQLGVIVDSESRVTVNITLEVGQIVESISVEATSPTVSAESGEIATLVSGTQVTEIALNGRNFTQLLALGPGVVSRQSGRAMGVGQEGNPLMAVHGGRISMNKYTYDGTIAMDTGGNRGLDMFPPMEAIEEVKILKSNYAADSGGYGYGIVNIVTKRGGQSYHGDVYYFLRNDALDARNFFDARVSKLKLNNFGYTLGGPFYIPGKYNTSKSKDFFFWSQSWAMRRGPQLTSFTTSPTGVFTATTPSAAMRQGDFTELSQGSPPIQLRDPLGGVFAGNIIPASRFDPNAVLLLNKYFPLPNRAGTPNYAVSPTSGTDWREELLRWDHEFSPKIRLTGRYVQDTWEQQQAIKRPAPQGFPTLGNFFSKPGKNFTGKLTTLFNPTTLNEVTFGASINRITNIVNPEGRRFPGLNIPEVFPQNFNNVIPNISLANGFSSIGLGDQLNNVNPVYTYRDDFSFQRSNHNLKAGFEIIRAQKFSTSYTDMQGSFTFNGGATGHSVADFLIGEAFQYTENEIHEKGYFYHTDYEMYVTDDWKVSRNLTLNVGVRHYIIVGGNGGYEKYDRISTFHPAAFDPARASQVTRSGDLVPGTGDPLNGILTGANRKGLDVPNSFKKTHYDTIGPRLGFAWSPSAGKTVVRGGYGLNYFWGANANEGRQTNLPFSRNVSIFNTKLSNPAGGALRPLPPSVNSVEAENPVPTIHHWSLGIQREMAQKVMFEIAYVGTHGTHLSRGGELNQPLPGTVVGGISANAVRPYLGYAGIGYTEESASSRYHALEAHALRRFSAGLLLEASYTFSKALGDIEGAPQDIRNKRGSFGLTELDRTHMFTFNYVYELPFFRKAKGLAGAALGGWQVSGITSFQSGLPNTITISGDRAQVGGGTQRPDLVGNPNEGRGQSLAHYFNTAAFALPALGRFGNSAPFNVRGPGLNNWDLNVFKNFRLKEAAKVQFGAEMFNAFNHPQFEGIGTTLGATTFGVVTSARDPRIIQFRLKLSY